MQISIDHTFHGEPSYVWDDNIFSTEELDYLQSITKLANTRATMNGNITDLSIRRTGIDWFFNNDNNAWFFEKISSFVSKANAHHFHYSLTSIQEPTQLTNYKSETFDTYAWHVDRGPGPTRKLSVVVQLSDPSEYDGGELQLLTRDDPEVILRKRGLVVIFPSFILHRVTPVTRGSRQSLVTWVSGPNFR